MRKADSRKIDPLSKVDFHCCGDGCGERFSAMPGRVVDIPDQTYHPFEYFAQCPECGRDAPQAAWSRNLLKAWPSATGPKTADGKKASAANLEGHPTPQEAQLTRFNAMKHGLFARTANYFPAKPGKYPHCDGCEHLETEACVPQRACLKRTELMLRHQVAFESGDPSLLMQLRSDTQAGIQALIDDMLLAIAQDGGPRLISPEWYYDKDGGFHLAEFIDKETLEPVPINKIEAHPLLKILMEYISKNSMTLQDLEMTPRSQDEQAALEGYMEQQSGEKQASLEYQARNTELLENLSVLVQRSHDRKLQDPVLIEHGEVENG